MTASNSHISWPRLVAFVIMSFLDPEDILIAASVCKAWKGLFHTVDVFPFKTQLYYHLFQKHFNLFIYLLSVKTGKPQAWIRDIHNLYDACFLSLPGKYPVSREHTAQELSNLWCTLQWPPSSMQI